MQYILCTRCYVVASKANDTHVLHSLRAYSSRFASQPQRPLALSTSWIGPAQPRIRGAPATRPGLVRHPTVGWPVARPRGSEQQPPAAGFRRRRLISACGPEGGGTPGNPPSGGGGGGGDGGAGGGDGGGEDAGNDAVLSVFLSIPLKLLKVIGNFFKKVCRTSLFQAAKEYSPCWLDRPRL